MDRRVTKARTANTGFASGGVPCKLRALCFYSSSVQVDSFVLRNPPERKARKHYRQVVEKEIHIGKSLKDEVRKLYQKKS